MDETDPEAPQARAAGLSFLGLEQLGRTAIATLISINLGPLKNQQSSCPQKMVLSYVFQVDASRDSFEKIGTLFFFCIRVFVPEIFGEGFLLFIFIGFHLALPSSKFQVGVIVLEKDVFRWICSKDFKGRRVHVDLPPRCFLDADSEAQWKMPPKLCTLFTPVG